MTKPGGPEVLELQEVPNPQIGPEEVLVEVKAAGVNRLDILQRMGLYPAPPGSPQDIPGVELAGTIAEVGKDVTNLSVGDRVFGIVDGGAYAAYSAVPAGLLARLPDNLSFTEGAAIPEAFITAHDALVTQGELVTGQSVLIHAAGSGVGTAALQIAQVLGAKVIGTVRSKNKIEPLQLLNPQAHLLVVEETSFAKSVLEVTDGAGVNVILELAGGSYLEEDLRCIASKGEIIVIGLLAGSKANLDLGLLLRKRVRLRGTTLRSRPLAEKISAVQAFKQQVVPLFETNILKAIIDRTFPLEQAAAAHQYMTGNANVGKIVLVGADTIRPPHR